MAEAEDIANDPTSAVSPEETSIRPSAASPHAHTVVTQAAPTTRPLDGAHPLALGDRWRAIALLGAGGMGSVYLAHDAELEELVALKMVRPSLAADPAFVARFREEVRLSRSVSSPFVARTHDLGEYGGRLFLTMQYVEGEALSARLDRVGALPIASVVRIARDVCAGLDAIHAAGVVHRDLKPANVLLARDGRAVIADFGIALRAEDGRHDVSGTPTYAAPEQIHGGHATIRSDIYALGALLYAAATGVRPFTPGRSGSEPPPNPREKVPSLPEAFASVVTRAMALDPKERYASAGALHDALAPLAGYGERKEDRLFVFTRDLARRARRLALRLDPSSGDSLRDTLIARLRTRLADTGDIGITDELPKAEAVLTGNISESGDSCDIRVELESRDHDVFFRHASTGSVACASELVDAVAIAIAGALGSAGQPTAERSVFHSRRVAELFLDAQNAYRNMTPPSVRRAVALLEEANRLEPGNATLLGWKSCALTRLRFYLDGPDDAADATEQAVTLGPNEAAPYVAAAERCLLDMRPVDAATAFVRALRRAPGLFDVRASFALFLGEIGALAPAVRLADALHASNPAYAGVLEPVMRAHASRGDFDAAQAIAQRAHKDIAGALRLHTTALRFAVWVGDRSAFRRVRDAMALEQLDAEAQRFIVLMSATMLDGVAPPRDLESVMRLVAPRRRAFFMQCLMELGAIAGDDVVVFEALDRAVAAGAFDVTWVDACPLFHAYRGSLHFETARRTLHRRAFATLGELDRALEASERQA